MRPQAHRPNTAVRASKENVAGDYIIVVIHRQGIEQRHQRRVVIRHGLQRVQRIFHQVILANPAILSHIIVK
ncbi:hypothetical protein SDC9_156302 [bioreactor metagenome]|uniref:Uncharacterized protein n=1 Tax=bioreactor metagenome TaxID=1076179 RepID=A0A645F8T9_9ZZZZ